MKNALLSFALILFFSFLHAQEDSKFGSISVTQISSELQKSTAQSILTSKIKPASGTEFRLIKTETDKLKFQHSTYQQYYRGIKVEFGTLKIHAKNGISKNYNGAYFDPSGLTTSPRVSKPMVAQYAKRFLGGTEFSYVTDEGLTKTNNPSVELVILPIMQEQKLYLAYKIHIASLKPELKMGTVYVDAQTGEVLKFKNLIFKCFEVGHESEIENSPEKTTSNLAMLASGTAATVYSGSQSIETDLDGSDYILYDQTRATEGIYLGSTIGLKYGVSTLNFNHSNDLNDYSGTGITEFTDGNNNWTAAEMSSDEDQYALDAHWGAEVVYDYFLNDQGRQSYNGSNGSIISYVHFDTNYTNAAWVSFTNGNGFMIYGDGSGSYTPLTSLDVAAHEIGHGVTNNAADLDYEYESGALNEGFSDIWAMVVDNYANNNYGTSKTIDEINDENGGGTLRSLSNPNAYGLPDTYGGTNWYNQTGCTANGTTNDYCGVHTNSGVIAYWFWLLSQGGSGTNDNGDSFNVSSIGMDDAAAVAYRMLTVYLTSTSDYADARDYAIQAAQDLFNSCSTQEQAVTNAFYAVGVGTAYTVVNPSVTSQPSASSTCEGDATSFTASGSDYDSLQWQVDDGNGFTDITNDATYSGATTTTLTITNPLYSMDEYDYRLEFTNSCSSVNSNSVALDVDEYPIASVVAENETCTGGDGSLIFTFSDNSNRTGIEFSIDGGNNYSYNYDDSLGSQTLSSLSAATYNVWVRWGNSDCPLELGDYTINTGTTPTASSTGTTNESCTLNDGSIELSFTDSATETQIDFSIDDGLNYDYTFDDVDTSGSITGLAQGDYNIWVSYDGNCAVDLGTVTVDSDAPIATVTAVDSSIGGSDGGLALTFIDNATRNVIKFSIDGGVNYPHNFNNSLGTASITGLAAATYNVWVAWGNDECPKELGDYTINESSNYTSIPDSNFENALYDLGYDDLLGDSKVPTALINTVTNLNVAYESISDITGIEAFTALTNFDCSNNSLTSVDVTSNLLLDTFRCDNNVLTNIDVSTNTALLYLECFDNSLETIDISNNLLLIKLYANDNNLTSLDVSINPALEDLECSNNNLTFLNFRNGNNANTSNSEFEATGNTGLTCIEVDDAAYSTTNWTNIDAGVTFSNYCFYTAIPDVNFENALEALGYDDISADGQVPTSLISGIETLNVNSSNIDDLTGIEDFVSLKSLSCRQNELISLNVSTLINLTTLKCRNNLLTSLDLSNNHLLKTINTRSNYITDLDFTNNPLLQTLNCRNNLLTSLDLNNNPALDDLECYSNGLTSLDLSSNTLLTSLDAHDNLLESLSVNNGNNAKLSSTHKCNTLII